MKITSVKTTPLLVPYTKPYYWAQGVIHGAEVLLVTVETDAGITGYGESVASPDAHSVAGFLAKAGAMCVGQDPFDNARLMAGAYHALFQALGTCSAPRFGGQVLSGLEMALWDVMGKATGRPVHQLLGGALRDKLQYFGFAMGETAQEVAAEAETLVQSGIETIYLKVGRGDALDLEISPAFISNVARQIEPSDGTMFPDLVVYNHLKCELIEVLGLLPVFNVLIIDFGGEVDTLQYNQAQKLYTVKEKAEFQSALIQIKESIRTQDLFLLGQAAIQSGRINQRFLPKPRLEEIIDIVIKHGAYGVCVAHSGTVAGVIYDPAVSISGLEQSLQENISGPLEFIETRTLQYKFQKSKIKENFNAF